MAGSVVAGADRSGVAQEAPVPCSQALTLSGLASIHFSAASSGVIPSSAM